MGNAKPFESQALEVPRPSFREERREERTRREDKEKETLYLGSEARTPERLKSSGEQMAPTRTKTLGSEKEHSYRSGSKPLRHR